MSSYIQRILILQPDQEKSAQFSYPQFPSQDPTFSPVHSREISHPRMTLRLDPKLSLSRQDHSFRAYNSSPNVELQKKLVVFRPKKSKPKNFVVNMLDLFKLQCKKFIELYIIPMFQEILTWVKIMMAYMIVSFETMTHVIETFIWMYLVQFLSDFTSALSVLRPQNIVLIIWGFIGPIFLQKNLKKQQSHKRERKQLTLVLDLDETLVHSSLVKPTSGQYQTFLITTNANTCQRVYMRQRPHLEEFLETVSQEYNICIFTASSMDYADIAIDLIDSKNVVMRRFYRQSCTKTQEGWAKDLTRISLDLDRIILLDNCDVAGSIHPDNHLLIPSWYQDEMDQCLLQFSDLLLKFANQWKANLSESKRIQEYISQEKNQRLMSQL